MRPDLRKVVGASTSILAMALGLSGLSPAWLVIMGAALLASLVGPTDRNTQEHTGTHRNAQHSRQQTPHAPQQKTRQVGRSKQLKTQGLPNEQQPGADV